MITEFIAKNLLFPIGISNGKATILCFTFLHYNIKITLLFLFLLELVTFLKHYEKEPFTTYTLDATKTLFKDPVI